jgi:glycosyltransferase involved in cell wall biosynthesis
MPRVLLVSYYTPPRSGVATIRTQQLIKYLPQHGWDVTPLTPALPDAASDVVQTPYVDLTATLKRSVGFGGRSAHQTLGIVPAARGVRRSLRQAMVIWGYRLVSYPDEQIGWFFCGRSALASELAAGKYDAVLSSSPPFTTHLMLATVRHKIPWVADYRDLWGGSDAYISHVRRNLDRVLDRWTLRRASAATTISEPMAATIRTLRENLRVDVVSNAFDDDEWREIPFGSDRRATFVHAGQLFGGRRDPRPLFRVVRSLIDAGEIKSDDIRIVLYSAVEPWLQEAIALAGLHDVVDVTGVVERDQVMRAERRADRLVVLLWEGANSEGILTGKLFEYFGARRPILAIGGPQQSAVDDLFAHTGAGVRVRDEENLRGEVLAAVTEHREGIARVTDSAKLAPYSAYEMARRFARVLDRVSGVLPAAQPEPSSVAQYSP